MREVGGAVGGAVGGGGRRGGDGRDLVGRRRLMKNNQPKYGT